MDRYINERISLEACMMCGKGRFKSPLCPLSLGIAIGVTSALAVLVWTVWVITQGMPPSMAAANIPMPTFETGAVHAFWALIKGFVFGFVVAFIYDLCLCIGKSFCKKDGSTCACGCGCCTVEKVDVINKQ